LNSMPQKPGAILTGDAAIFRWKLHSNPAHCATTEKRDSQQTLSRVFTIMPTGPSQEARNVTHQQVEFWRRRVSAQNLPGDRCSESRGSVAIIRFRRQTASTAIRGATNDRDGVTNRFVEGTKVHHLLSAVTDHLLYFTRSAARPNGFADRGKSVGGSGRGARMDEPVADKAGPSSRPCEETD